MNNSNTNEVEKLIKSTASSQSSPDKLKSKRPKKSITLSRLKRRILKHTKLIRFTFIALVLTAVVFIFINLFQIFAGSQAGFYTKLFKDFVFAPEEKIAAIDGRTNFLILGKGGLGHEAPDLTDTIIFASVDHINQKINLISLPRDIWIPDLRTKLNATYYWGNQKEPPIHRTTGPVKTGGGLILAKSTVEEVVGQPISYALVIDFSGFKKIIDVLGGIEVEVENSFTDERYPIAGRENDLCDGDIEYKCRYETITFEKGKQFMDGTTALKFVRSRNAKGDEGTDLARAARQEQAIKAIQEKVLSREILFSPRKLFTLKDAVLESIETDIRPESAAVLARKIYDSKDNLSSHVLSEDYLENPPKSAIYDNLYVFIPKEVDPEDSSKRSWQEIHNWVECTLNSQRCN